MKLLHVLGCGAAKLVSFGMWISLIGHSFEQGGCLIATFLDNFHKYKWSQVIVKYPLCKTHHHIKYAGKLVGKVRIGSRSAGCTTVLCARQTSPRRSGHLSERVSTTSLQEGPSLRSWVLGAYSLQDTAGGFVWSLGCGHWTVKAAVRILLHGDFQVSGYKLTMN